jgi:hypothetical protein
MRRTATTLALALLSLTATAARDSAADQPAKVSEAEQPWKRLLQGADAEKAKQLDEQIGKLIEARQFADALKATEEVAALRARVQGVDHWEAVNSKWDAEAMRRLLKHGKETQAEYAGVARQVRQYNEFIAKGKYQEAQALMERVLTIRRKALGEEHPETAQSYDDMGNNLISLGRNAEAEAVTRKGLAIRRRLLGDDHLDTSSSYYGLATCLNNQDRYAEAEVLSQKALVIVRKSRGDDQDDTAAVYNCLAISQNGLGRYAEAEEGFRKSLAIHRKSRGDDHADTTQDFSNLAANQYAQGHYAEAEEGHRMVLAIRLRTLGDEHPDTGLSYNEVAVTLNARGKYAEATPLYEKALAIRRKALGEEHPLTGNAYNTLAANLTARGKCVEAAPLYEKALAIRRKDPGDDSSTAAVSYHGLAYNLHARGKYAEAEAGYKKALDIRRKALGDEHPDTAQSYDALAANLHAQGKYAEAEALWVRAAECFARARPRLTRDGLERAAKTGESSPLPALAAVLARNGKPAEAWRRFEESLAQGTRDDLSARLRRPEQDQIKQAELVARLERLDRLVETVATPDTPAPEQKKRRDELLSQRRQSQDELDGLASRLEEKYGPAAGRCLPREDIQAALPADAALVGWLDLPGAATAADPDGEHRAFLLRAAGEPVVVHLRGSGLDGHWVEADTRLPAELRAVLQTPSGDWRPLADRLRKQRLDPLTRYLGAEGSLPPVRRLILLPSVALAGLPVEALAEGRTISYAMSGTLFAQMRQQARPTTVGLLALADPVFETPGATAPRRPPLPPGGALLTAVVPDANADRAGLKAGDVLLRYNGTALSGRADLKPVPGSTNGGPRVAVTVWREGKTLDRKLLPGELGAILADGPAPAILATKFEGDLWLARSRGGDEGKWNPLPGSRVEAEGLQKLFTRTGNSSLLLAGSQASEQRLYELARSGELGTYRYLHLATHGDVDDRFPLRSAVILAHDHLPDPGRQLQEGLPAFDGRLTARKVLLQWHLHADLVTLSACQTGLGKYEGGEGFVGFAQALILCGSRSVCLSLWKVDDTATALLMGRFYENLLGKRDGLTGPLPKAAALSEAKTWLRGLNREEAAKGVVRLADGTARGKGQPKLPLAVPAARAGSSDGDHPYAHPYYWAAFVLIGDPD